MKNQYTLVVTIDTRKEEHSVDTAAELKELLENEYSWNHIYGVHSHSAELLDEDGNVIASIDLPEHDDFSSESLEEEDDGEVSNLYARCGEDLFDNDYDGSIAEFCDSIQ